MKRFFCALFLAFTLALSAQQQFTRMYSHSTLILPEEELQTISTPSRIDLNYGGDNYVVVSAFGERFIYQITDDVEKGYDKNSKKPYQQVPVVDENEVVYIVRVYDDYILFYQPDTEKAIYYFNKRQ